MGKGRRNRFVSVIGFLGCVVIFAHNYLKLLKIIFCGLKIVK